MLSSLLGDSVALEGSEPQTRPHVTLCSQVESHRGKMVEVLSLRVLARHGWRVSDLLPLVIAVVHGVGHGGAVLVLVHGAGWAQRPQARLGVQPLSRSLQGARTDAGEIPRAAHHHHHHLQPPAPLPKEGFLPSLPVCAVSAASSASPSPPSPSGSRPWRLAAGRKRG